MRLYTRTKRRLAANRLAGTMTKAYQKKQPTRTAGQLGNGLSMIDGQLYNTGSTNGHGTVAVVNLGRPAAAIYKPQSNGEIILGGGSGGGCSDGGSGGVGIHALDGAYHTGTLAQSQAPWAALDSDLQDHIADPIHHTRLHDVLNADDHEIVAARYTVLGTPSAANTLAAWMTGSNGTAGNVLLRSDSNGALFLNDVYAYNRVQSQSFAGGFGGNGYRLDYGVTNAGKATLEVDDLSVRRRMTVRELLIRKIRTTNGDIFVSSGGEVATATDLGGGSWALTFREDHGFLEDDLIAAQAWTGSGVYRLEMTVTAVTDTKTLTATLDDGGGDTPGSVLAAGLSVSFARHGNETDADRQGVIYLSSDDTGAPFIRVLDGIDSWAKWGDPSTLKMQLGRLDGITHAVMGNLSGYGMFATDNAYMEGLVVAGNGDTVMGDDGLNIQAGTEGGGSWSNHSDKITFAEDPMATLDDDNTIAQIGANRYTSGSEVHRSLLALVQSGAETSTDAAIIEWLAQYIDPDADVPIQYARIAMGANNGAPYVQIGTQADVAAAGAVYLQTALVDFAGHIRMSGGGDIGTALAPVGTLYADELVVGTTYTENTGYINDTRYMPRTELAVELAGYALDGHTHAGFITSAELTAELADYATEAYVDAEIAGIPAPDLSNYWTKAQADGRYTQATTYNGHVAAANPHGTALADLTARDYDDLTNREHLLADAVGLGPDHTISGATAGHVLRATGADAARFMQLGATDLGVTAARYSVLGTPNAADTIAAWATASDGTAGNVLLRSDSNGDLILNDLTINDLTAEDAVFGGVLTLGDYWQIDAGGNLKSTDPSYTYADPEQGTLITPDGRIVALDIDARSGRFRAAVYEIDSTVVGPSSEIWTYAGGAMTQATTTIDSSGAITVAVQDGRLGHYRQYQVGETIRLRGPATSTLTPSSGTDAYLPYFLWQMFPAYTDDFAAVADVYLTIDSVSDEGTHFAYTCTWAHGSDNVAFPAGTPVIGYGAASDSAKLGAMRITSDANGPRLTAFEYGDDAWVEDGILALGSIGANVIGWLDADERGIITGTSIQSEDDFSGIVGSNKRMLIQNPDLVIKSNGLERLRTASDGLHLGLYVDADISGDIDPDDYLNEPFRTGESLLTFSDTPSDYDSATGGRGHLRFEATDYPSYYGSNYPGIARISDISGELAVRTSAGIASFVITVDSDLDQYFPGLLSDPPAASIALQSAAANSQITLDAGSTNVSGLLIAETAHAGRLRITDIPTSATGLIAGDVWNDSGTLKIVS